MHPATSLQGSGLVRTVGAVCTNKGGHRDAFLNERCKVPRSLLSR